MHPLRATLALLVAVALAPAPARASGCPEDEADRCDGGRKAQAWSAPEAPRLVEVVLGPAGFSPAQVTVKRGQPVRFVIERTGGAVCAAGLTIPGLAVDAVVPADRPLEIVVTPGAKGVFPVNCRGEGVAGLLVVG